MFDFELTDFVRRQTPDSNFAHYDGEIESVCKLGGSSIERRSPSIVVLNPDPKGFYTSVVPVLLGGKYDAVVGNRQDGECHLVSVTASAYKVEANHVQLVLYSRSALSLESIAIDKPWGLASINCSPTNSATPMRPETMARNMLRKPGGTYTEYTPEEFAESVWFWSQHVQCTPPSIESKGR